MVAEQLLALDTNTQPGESIAILQVLTQLLSALPT